MMKPWWVATGLTSDADGWFMMVYDGLCAWMITIIIARSSFACICCVALLCILGKHRKLISYDEKLLFDFIHYTKFHWQEVGFRDPFKPRWLFSTGRWPSRKPSLSRGRIWHERSCAWLSSSGLVRGNPMKQILGQSSDVRSCGLFGLQRISLQTHLDEISISLDSTTSLPSAISIDAEEFSRLHCAILWVRQGG